MAVLKMKRGSSVTTLLDTGSAGNILAGSMAYPNASWSLDLSGYKDKVFSGIGLVWSEFDPATSTGMDYGWQTTFVPKFMLADGKKYECHFPVSIGGTAKQISSKIIFVQNWKLTGTASNVGTVNVNGTQFNNSKYVIRSVVAL